VKMEMNPRTLEAVQMQIKDELKPPRAQWGQVEDAGSPITSPVGKGEPTDVRSRGKGVLEREFSVEVQGSRQTWTMLVHLYKQGGKLFIVRCYAPKNHYDRVKDDFREALESFTILEK